MGIDDKSSHPELCSGVADGVTRNMVCLFREPDAGNLPVRFDEREQETAPSQTGLRWRGESQVDSPPGDYSYCACSRLYCLKPRRSGCAPPVRFTSAPVLEIDTDWKIPELSRSLHSGMEMPTSCAPTPGRSSTMRTSSAGFRYGKG